VVVVIMMMMMMMMMMMSGAHLSGLDGAPHVLEHAHRRTRVEAPALTEGLRNGRTASDCESLCVIGKNEFDACAP
jgi:hypothetical protein